MVLGWPGILPRPAVRPCNAPAFAASSVLDGHSPLRQVPTFSLIPVGANLGWHICMARRHEKQLAAHPRRR
ncbi:Hypothetical protein EPM1_2116 [Stenotrophomonas maltophilia EPM1]|nr:Hypothetical protein EPM1_2116 [Stenotrophomonas maltophilia EPM1]